MKTKLLFLFVVLFSLQTNAQTLNPTVSIATAGTANTFKGGYTFAYPASGTPWAGPLISFGGFSNNYDCQLNSNYAGSGISYRTRNGDTGTWNAWNELATRGLNTFTGNQTINGNLYIFGVTNKIVWNNDATNYYIGNFPVTGSSGLDIHSHGGVRFGDALSNSVMQITNGKVGIGSTNPDEKLTVKGKIHAEEIKVDLAVPADYVFQKYYTGKSELKADYTMPTLAEIESFTKENHHLPNVPSAQEIQENGLTLGEMSNALLQKVEELTLYAIEQQKELDRLKTENENYKSLSERLSAIEKELKK